MPISHVLQERSAERGVPAKVGSQPTSGPQWRRLRTRQAPGASPLTERTDRHVARAAKRFGRQCRPRCLRFQGALVFHHVNRAPQPGLPPDNVR
jgi:hypothetical protein